MAYSYLFSPDLDKDLRKVKKKNPEIHERIMNKVLQIIDKPELYKSLRYVGGKIRRVHIGPFVLTFEIQGDSIMFTALDHHDKAYKKYR